MRLSRALRAAAIGLLAVAILGYGLVSLAAAAILTQPFRQTLKGDPRASLDLAFESVTFPARVDAVSISAWHIPAREATRAIVLVHGMGGCRTCEFQGKVLEFAKAMNARGFAVLMIDLRGHGTSGPGRFTFGQLERRDVLGAVDYLLGRGFKPGRIGVLGISMGAASSIGAAAEEPAIGALVEDSGYSDLNPLLQVEFPRSSGLPVFFLPGTLAAARLITGADITQAVPVREIVKIAPRPVMVIHARGDALVPFAQAGDLARAAGVEAWITPADGHARSYAASPAEYAARVGDFFERSLK